MTENEILNRFERRLTESIDDSKLTLTAFAESVANNFTAMAYTGATERALQATARLEQANRFLHYVQTGVSLSDIREAAVDEVMVFSRQAQNHSTSAISNELSALRMAVVSEYADWLRRNRV